MKPLPLKHRSPREIYDVMRRSVIGQDEALKTVATAISAHISRCIHNQKPWVQQKIKKDNLLVLGPTGTGKTESIRAAIRDLDLPFPIAVAPVNTLSNSGYKGRNIEDVLWDLAHDARRLMSENPDRYFEKDDFEYTENDGKKIRKINSDTAEKVVIQLCEHGILILDEFDKIRFSSDNSWEAVYKRNMQYELLKIVEGSKGIGESPLTQKIDTSNILIIAMGAFTDLLNPPPEPVPVGFSVTATTAPEHEKIVGIPTTTEICGFGFVEELVGRLPLRCRYNALSARNLYQILRESEVSPVIDFENLFLNTGNQLYVSNTAMKEIARKAHAIGTGARALRTVLGEVLYPILYEVDGTYKNHYITINKDVLNGGKPAIKPLPPSWAVVNETVNELENILPGMQIEEKKGQP